MTQHSQITMSLSYPCGYLDVAVAVSWARRQFSQPHSSSEPCRYNFWPCSRSPRFPSRFPRRGPISVSYLNPRFLRTHGESQKPPSTRCERKSTRINIYAETNTVRGHSHRYQIIQKVESNRWHGRRNRITHKFRKR